MDGYFKEYESGNATLSKITGSVASLGRMKNINVDMRRFLRYEDVEKKIVYKLVNTGRNCELLEDIPHINFLDLSVIFQCMLLGAPGGTASILIHNAHMKLWDVTVDDLIKAAKENTPHIMGSELKTMEDVMCEIMSEELPEDFDYDAVRAGMADSVPMYVLSNRYRVDGAACVLYPMLLSDICRALKSSFYIIPSSIHEVLVLPADNTDTGAEILAMIKEINDTQVKPEEILSYSLYYYDGGENRLSIV